MQEKSEKFFEEDLYSNYEILEFEYNKHALENLAKKIKFKDLIKSRNSKFAYGRY